MGKRILVLELFVAAWLSGCQGRVDAVSPSCTAEQKLCGSECKTVATDQQKCGACGNTCASGQTCQNGQCACSAGLLPCGGACVSSNAAHCGDCSTVTGGSLATQSGGSGNRPFNDLWLALLPVFGVNSSVLSGASGALMSTGALPGIFS